jgi:hypothetical protein
VPGASDPLVNAFSFFGARSICELRADVKLHDLFARDFTCVGDFGRRHHAAIGRDLVLSETKVAQLEGGVAQSESERERRRNLVAIELPIAVPQVIGDLGRVLVEERQIFGALRNDVRQLAARVGMPEQYVGGCMAAPSWPGYPSSRIAATLSRHASVMTALPAMMATTVRGFASATRRRLGAQSRSVGRLSRRI